MTDEAEPTITRPMTQSSTTSSEQQGRDRHPAAADADADAAVRRCRTGRGAPDGARRSGAGRVCAVDVAVGRAGSRRVAPVPRPPEPMLRVGVMPHHSPWARARRAARSDTRCMHDSLPHRAAQVADRGMAGPLDASAGAGTRHVNFATVRKSP